MSKEYNRYKRKERNWSWSVDEEVKKTHNTLCKIGNDLYAQNKEIISLLKRLVDKQDGNWMTK